MSCLSPLNLATTAEINAFMQVFNKGLNLPKIANWRLSQNVQVHLIIVFQPQPINTHESFDVGVNADCTHWHQRQKPGVIWCACFSLIHVLCSRGLNMISYYLFLTIQTVVFGAFSFSWLSLIHSFIHWFIHWLELWIRAVSFYMQTMLVHGVA